MLGILPLSRQACRICTEDPCPDGVVALLQFEVQCVDDQVYLCQHSLGVIHPHKPAQLPFLTQVIELCAGIAATSQGAKQAGFVPTVAVEWRPPIHKLLRANFEGEAFAGGHHMSEHRCQNRHRLPGCTKPHSRRGMSAIQPRRRWFQRTGPTCRYSPVDLAHIVPPRLAAT